MKKDVDMFPQTDGSKDINAVLSSQVESDLENHGSIVPTLKKQDFYAAVILILAGVGTIIVSAFII